MVSVEERLPQAGITQKSEWDEIAVAYSEAVENFSFYKEMSADIVEAAKGRKRVLDLGCGTAAHIDRLLHENPESEVVGVDSNLQMLRIAQQRLQQHHPGKRYKLFIDDATTFQDEGKFDAIISSNVLFNLEKPMDYLDNAYKLLAPGGRLILTSPQALVNMDLAEQVMREDFRHQGTYEEKKGFIDTVWRVNRSFQGRSNVYRTERMREVLKEFIGFDSIAQEKKTYGNNFFFVAEKSESPQEVKYVLSRDEGLLNKGFRLRYHWLFDRYNGISEKQDEIYMDPCDERATGWFAIEGEKQKVVGFANYVSPGDDLPFGDKKLLDAISMQHGPVGAFNGFYVVRTRQNSRIGVNMIKIFTKEHEGNLGIGAIVTEARPEIASGLQVFGWQKMGMTSSGFGGKELPVALMMKAIPSQSSYSAETPKAGYSSAGEPSK